MGELPGAFTEESQRNSTSTESTEAGAECIKILDITFMKLDVLDGHNYISQANA